MAMGTIYKSTTGLLAFSKGLDLISNNVANLNTPGFKRSDIFFRELFYQSQAAGSGNASVEQIGNGVKTDGTYINFDQGDIQQTGNQTDAAVNGKGFFVLRTDEGNVYTRVGQFNVDEDGILRPSTMENARVAGIDQDGRLVDIDISDFRNMPAQETTRVRFAGNLSTSGTEHEIGSLEVIDTLGRRHTLRVAFEDNSAETPRSWIMDVTDEDDQVVAQDLEIRFQEDGSLVEGFNAVSFDYQPEGAGSVNIEFNFGEPGSLAGQVSVLSGGDSDLAVRSQDGFQAGSLLNMGFAEDGTLQLEYTNEQSRDVARLALASFDQQQALKQVGNGLFTAPEGVEPVFAGPTEGIMGELVGGGVEISNIELSQEFTELIVMQRGFQGSSQVITVYNEMIQQLLDIGRGGG